LLDAGEEHDMDLTTQHIRQQLAEHDEIVHSTIEIQQCR
jgi:hypothetical protein